MQKLSEFTYKNWSLKGVSEAGTGSCFIIPEFKTCFDVAQGLSFSYGMKQYLITHGHMDHAGGLAYIVSQRSLLSLPPAPMYLPPDIVKPITEILNNWKIIEQFEYQYNIVPAPIGEKFELSNDLFFKPFKTIHRVPSQGYTIYQKIKKLKPEYQGLSTFEIKKLKENHKTVDQIIEVPLFSYTGDTQIEFLDHSPEVAQSKVLLMECTYFDDQRPVERARLWGHTHFYEIIDRLDDIQCDKILLTHNSAKYSKSYLNEILNKRLKPEQRDRVLLFP